jgi:hypothetical protein
LSAEEAGELVSEPIEIVAVVTLHAARHAVDDVLTPAGDAGYTREPIPIRALAAHGVNGVARGWAAKDDVRHRS